MDNDINKALEAVEFCISVIQNPRIPEEDIAIWSCGTSSKPRITLDILKTICEVLKSQKNLE